MPNTLDRLVDGTVAAHLMHHTAHLLHPSQTVMSYIKKSPSERLQRSKGSLKTSQLVRCSLIAPAEVAARHGACQQQGEVDP